VLEVSDSLMLARDRAYYPVTKAIYEIVMGEYALTNHAIASAVGVWAMILLAATLMITSKILGKKMGAIFRV
jgi:iron(III) transport system permease protein